MKKILNQGQNFDQLLNEFFRVEESLKTLPELSGLEKVQFDTDIAIEHLYYSSKLEGTILSQQAIQKAIHAEGFQAA
jgi:hypothetical protein